MDAVTLQTLSMQSLGAIFGLTVMHSMFMAFNAIRRMQMLMNGLYFMVVALIVTSNDVQHTLWYLLAVVTAMPIAGLIHAVNQQ